MKKTILLFILIAVVFSQQKSFSQQFKMGANLGMMMMKGEGPENVGSDYLPDYEIVTLKANPLNFQCHFSFDLPWFKIDPDNAIGTSSVANLGYLISPKLEGLHGAVTLDLPEYITFRHGRDATRKSTKNIGFGAGFGYSLKVMPFPLGSVCVFGEFTFARSYFIRLNYDLQKRSFYNEYTSLGNVPTLTFRSAMLTVGYGF